MVRAGGPADVFPEREQLERYIQPAPPERSAIEAVEQYGQMVLQSAVLAAADGDALSVYAARANALDGDPGERLTEDEVIVRVERGVYTGTLDRKHLEAELRRLDEVRALAKKITPAQDSKLQRELR